MTPANDNGSITQRVNAIAISSINCVAVTGMSWSWCIRFARAHDVPIWRVGERKQLINAHAFETALARVAADRALGPMTVESERERIRAEIRAELRGKVRHG